MSNQKTMKQFNVIQNNKTILPHRYLFWKEKFASPASVIIITMSIRQSPFTNHFQLQKKKKKE